MAKRRKQFTWSEFLAARKVYIGVAGAVVLTAAAAKAWNDLDWPIPASRQWVFEAQYPIQQSVSAVLLGQWQSRIGAIKDRLLSLENEKTKASTAVERKRLEFQADELNKEWADLDAKIKGAEATRK